MQLFREYFKRKEKPGYFFFKHELFPLLLFNSDCDGEREESRDPVNTPVSIKSKYHPSEPKGPTNPMDEEKEVDSSLSCSSPKGCGPGWWGSSVEPSLGDPDSSNIVALPPPAILSSCAGLQRAALRAYGKRGEATQGHQFSFKHVR